MISLNAMIKAAKKSKHHSQKHACIVFRGGRVVSVSTNKRCHAEYNALRWIKEPHNLVILSVRVNKKGKLTNARPCSNCMDYIRSRNVRVVFYSNAEGKILREKL